VHDPTCGPGLGAAITCWTYLRLYSAHAAWQQRRRESRASEGPRRRTAGRRGRPSRRAATARTGDESPPRCGSSFQDGQNAVADQARGHQETTAAVLGKPPLPWIRPERFYQSQSHPRQDQTSWCAALYGVPMSLNRAQRVVAPGATPCPTAVRSPVPVTLVPGHTNEYRQTQACDDQGKSRSCASSPTAGMVRCTTRFWWPVPGPNVQPT